MLLLLIRQQLVDELPDDLLGRGVQDRIHIHYEGVYVSGKATEEETVTQKMANS